MDVNDYLKPGLTRQQDFIVEETHTAAHIGSGAVKALATPWMVAFMEITARTLLDEHLPEGYSSVGIRVNVRHLAPSALGSQLRAEVTVDAIAGYKVTLSVAVWDREQQVGAGNHERHVIDVQRFLKRVEKAN